MILDEYVEIKINARNIGWYRSRGYECNLKDIINVKPTDLSVGTHVLLHVKCDVCGSEKYIIQTMYRKSVDNGGYYSCSTKCGLGKLRQTNLKNRGVEYPAQSKDSYEKFKKTCLEKYGYEYPIRNEEIKIKTQKTNLERYGCKCTSQNKEVRKKQIDSLNKNGTQKVSAQQRYLNQLYRGELNYPCDFYSLDVFLPEYKLDIEYDGGGHNLAVKQGEISQEEFNQKEIIRGKYVRSKGYKQMRIISPHDHLPSDKVLKDMLNETTTFLLTTNHTWIEWYVEEGKYKDATGTYDYDYGELITKRQLYSKLNEEIPEQSSDCSF